MYNPINDEKTQYTFTEFIKEFNSAITEYFKDLNNANEWVKDKHTWAEWMAAFNRYMSW